MGGHPRDIGNQLDRCKNKDREKIQVSTGEYRKTNDAGISRYKQREKGKQRDVQQQEHSKIKEDSDKYAMD